MRCSVSFKWFRIFVLRSPSKHLLQSSPINAQIAQWSSGFSMSFNIRPTNLILLTKSTSPLMLFDSFINSLEYNFSLSLLISFSLFSLLFFRVAVYSDVFCLISVSVINRPTNQPNILMQLEYHRDWISSFFVTQTIDDDDDDGGAYNECCVWCVCVCAGSLVRARPFVCLCLPPNGVMGGWHNHLMCSLIRAKSTALALCRCCKSFYLSFATRVHRYGFSDDIFTIWYGDFGQSVHRQANEFVQMFWFRFIW